MRRILIASCLALLAACMPMRRIVVHDGLQTTVVDGETKKPLAGAFAYDGIETGGSLRVLARSDPSGRLELEPKTRLVLSSPMGEKLVGQELWICKEGYEPVRVGGRAGWNADYAPSHVFTPAVTELKKSASTGNETCSRLRR